MGVLVRDADGKTIGALSKKIWAPLKAVEVEAKAMEAGLKFAKNLLIHDFILESDSLLVVTNAMKELSPPPSSVAQWLPLYAVLYQSLGSLDKLSFPMFLGKEISRLTY